MNREHSPMRLAVWIAAALILGWLASQGSRIPPLALAALGLNLLFLVVAVGLWFWFQWEVTRR
jgi:hypothetical protein